MTGGGSTDVATPNGGPQNGEAPHAVPGDAAAPGGGLLLRAVLVRLRFVAALAVLLLVAASWETISDRVRDVVAGGAAAADAAAATHEYFCPMHPAVVRGDPGSCPSCGMALSRRRRAEVAALPPGVLARRTYSPYRVAQAGVRTTPVAWRPLSLEVTAPGVLRFDETRLRRFGAGFAARVVSVEGSFEGARVPRGTPLVRLFSAEVQTALQSYVSSLRQLEDAASRSATSAAERLRQQVDSLRKQLLQWGLDDEQLALAEASTAPVEDVAVRAPFDGVVLHCEVAPGEQVGVGTPLVHLADPAALVAVLRVRRADAALLREGLAAEISDPTLPEVRAPATIAQIAPAVDEATQTVSVRLAVEPSPLRPGTAVTARLRIPVTELEPWKSQPLPPPGPARVVFECPMHDLVQEEPGICRECGTMKLVRREIPGGPQPGDVLALPETAVIDTGRLRAVYVESSPGVFDAREVVLGPRAGAFYPVLRGIAAGERVATAGSFLLDAETRLDPAAAATYFGATGAPTGPAQDDGR